MNEEEYRKMETRALRAEGKLADILEVLQEHVNTPLNEKIPAMTLLQIGLIVKRGEHG